MNTSQINLLLSRNNITANSFRGTYSVDTLPTHVESYPSSYVCNIAPSWHGGLHWCAFILTQKADGTKHGVFIDSYGLAPQAYSMKFWDFLDLNCDTWIYNRVPLQQIDSKYCGHYCIYFIVCLTKGSSCIHEKQI